MNAKPCLNPTSTILTLRTHACVVPKLLLLKKDVRDPHLRQPKRLIGLCIYSAGTFDQMTQDVWNTRKYVD